MLRRLVLLCALLAASVQPLRAQEIASDPAVTQEVIAEPAGSERYVGSIQAAVPRGIAAYGPFRVLDRTRAALVDVTDGASPAQFAAMLRAYPNIALIEMIECPGTEDDRANLRLGRMIRARGIATLVPAGGSVRSGGVELFLAGAQRIADPAAEFAVHSWADEDGREARDYPADAPENRAYIDYYREMGMAPGQAQAFYAMTNSVPFKDAKWFNGAEMARWVSLNRRESLDSLASVP
ncbi:MAG: alpha/beta hydrolase [Sphingomonadaceae bacterium]|nr:alpha/beta hydrolase [Sphingomonadaceae bacterium]